MHDINRRIPVFCLAVLVLAMAAPAIVDADESPDASDHVLAAELALHRMSYVEAAREYRLAAEKSRSTEIAKQATRIASSFGFNEDALKAAQRWLELDENDDEALFHVARLQLRMGKTRAARKSYRELIDRGDTSPANRLLSLISVLGEESPEPANDVMTSLLKSYKDLPEAHYAAAVTAVQADDLESARSRVQRAIALQPDDWLELKAELLLGRIMLLSGDRDEAIAHVARLIGDNPRPEPDARMELALLMMAAGRDDDALSQVNQVLLENSNHIDALRMMAIINFRQQNLDAAEQDFQDLLASGNHTMDALYYLARIADFRGDETRAIRLYSQVVAGDSAVSAQSRAAALVAYGREQPDEALEQLEEFAREHPQHAIDVVRARAQLLAALERYPESLALYDQLIEYRPDSESASLGRAELLLRMERLDEAVEQYEISARRWPDSALSLNALGYTLADRTDRYKEAEKLIRKALEFEPESAAIIDSLGWVLHKLGDNEQALVELRRAYERLQDPEVASHIVDVLAALDRHEEALAFLVQAEERTPDNPLLQAVRARIFPDSSE